MTVSTLIMLDDSKLMSMAKKAYAKGLWKAFDALVCEIHVRETI